MADRTENHGSETPSQEEDTPAQVRERRAPYPGEESQRSVQTEHQGPSLQLHAPQTPPQVTLKGYVFRLLVAAAAVVATAFASTWLLHEWLEHIATSSVPKR